MTTYRVCCFLRRFGAASTNEPSEAVREVFQAYADGGGVLEEEALRRFLREVQGEADADAGEAAREAMAFAAERRLIKKGGGLTVEGFHRWFCSDANAAIDPSRQVYQDMGLPLSHYFIYTGHNSYLTGNQLSSGCSEAPIVKALRDGVRVIELDLWPNAAKDAVHVTHGRTLTSPVDLGRCLDAIREHAFVSSPFPVILTLEDHITPDLQAKVAKMIKETFEDMLFVPEPSARMAEFPSPDALRGKIIVSTKPPKEYLQAKTNGDDEPAAGNGVWGEDISEGKAVPCLSEQDSGKRADEAGDDEAAAGQADADAEAEKKASAGANDEYRRLIAIQLTRRKHDMEQDLKVDPEKVSRLSLGEKAYEKAIVSHGPHIVRFTQRNLLRIFPRSTRITSSNYNPLMGWRYGVQMVAANMQGHGRKLWLTQGMFRANGGCGYVRKPDVLMHPDKVFDPTADMPVKTRLQVTVYMGDGWRFDFRKTHFDRCSPPDFYARVGIAGVAADTRMERTAVMADAWVPAWDHVFVFPLAAPELALLRVEVHESDNHQRDDFGGQTCLPVWELRPGIRSVALCDHAGRQLPSVRLLMRFDFLPSSSSS